MTTSKKDASKAGKLLQDPKVSKPVKSVAGSDVSQANSKLVLRRGFWRRGPRQELPTAGADVQTDGYGFAAARPYAPPELALRAHTFSRSTSLCSCSLRASMSCS